MEEGLEMLSYVTIRVYFLAALLAAYEVITNKSESLQYTFTIKLLLPLKVIKRL